MSTRGERLRRPAWTNHRSLGLAWLACILPFIVVGGWRLKVSPAAELGLVELPSIDFQQRLEGQAYGVDRRGPMVAWLTGDGVIHRLRPGQGSFRIETYPTPCRPMAIVLGPGLMTADQDADGLLDLMVIEDLEPLADALLVHLLPGLADGRCGPGRKARTAVRVGSPLPEDCFVESARLRLEGRVGAGGRRSRTQVIDVARQRLVAVLDGTPCRVVDMDGDGGDDVLTAEAGAEPGQTVLRLYLGRAGALAMAGQVAVHSGDLLGEPGSWSDCADVDGDGQLELLACEQDPDRVRIWRLTPNPAAPGI